MKLVIFNNSVENDTQLLNSFRSDVKLINIKDYNLDSLIDEIGETNYSNLAFLYHFEYDFSIPFLKKDNNTYNFVNDNLINLINHLKSNNSNLKIDLLSCNLNAPEFISEITQIKTDLNVSIRYSLDQTGNGQGNWLLESDSVDIKSVYFTNNINNWEGVLLASYYSSCGTYGPLFSNENFILKRKFLNKDIDGNPQNVVYDKKLLPIKYSNSSIVVWGDSSSGGSSAPTDTDIISIVKSSEAYAALKSDGTVKTWGISAWGGDSSGVTSDLVNVISIYSTNKAFAALKSDGSVVTWGLAAEGGDYNDSTYGVDGTGNGGGGGSVTLSNIKAVFSTNKAFAAIDSSGDVYTWGDNSNGGDSSGASLSNIKMIYSTYGAFTALDTSNTLTSWGNSGNGGVSGVLTNIERVYSNYYSFVSISSSGTVLTWGLASSGADINDASYGIDGTLNGGSGGPTLLTDVKEIYSTDSAYAALKTDGSVVTWGNNVMGGNSSSVTLTNIVSVYSNMLSFAALKNDGTVITWGNSTNGGDSSSVSSDLVNVKMIYSNIYSFAALKKDGSVIVWGNSLYGGDATSVSSDISSNVVKIVSTDTAYAALKTDGSVVTWGDSTNGGNSTSVSTSLTNIVDIASNSKSFVAIKNTNDSPNTSYTKSQLGFKDSRSVNGIITGNDDSQYGFSVDLNDDGVCLIVGSSTESSFGKTENGVVRVYTNQGGEWVQYGQDIVGEENNTEFGKDVSINDAGNIIAIADRKSSNNLNTENGAVYIYEYDPSKNIFELIQTYTGSSDNDNFGSSIDLSNDGSTLAVGITGIDQGATGDVGKVEIYQNSGSWPVTPDLEITNTTGTANDKLGVSVSLNSDGSIVAVGYRETDVGSETNEGEIRVYGDLDLGLVSQIGQTITGSGTDDNFGLVKINGNGDAIICGGLPKSSGSTTRNARVYTYDVGTTLWVQVGSDISVSLGNSTSDNDGLISYIAIGDNNTFLIADVGTDTLKEYSYDSSGYTNIRNTTFTGTNVGETLSLSKNGLVAVLGDPTFNSNQGQIITKKLQPEFNVVLSETLTPPVASAAGGMGMNMAMNEDGSLFAIAFPNEAVGATTEAGVVRVYTNGGGSYSQIGSDINGSGASDKFGRGLAISGDGSYLAIGTYGFGATDTGILKIYHYDTDWNLQDDLGSNNQFVGSNGFDYFGDYLSLNQEGTICVVGAVGVDRGGFSNDVGEVSIFTRDSNKTWSLVETISNLAVDIENMGGGLSINDGNVIFPGTSNIYNIFAVGLRKKDYDSLTECGEIRVFKSNNEDYTGWSQFGSSIYGDNDNDELSSVKINNAGNILVCSGINTTSNQSVTKVYQYDININDWTQVGDTLTLNFNNTTSVPKFQYISLSENNDFIIGCPDDNNSRIYSIDLENSKLILKNIIEDSTGSSFGSTVVISKEHNMLAISDLNYNSDDGRIKVYNLEQAEFSDLYFGTTYNDAIVDTDVSTILTINVNKFPLSSGTDKNIVEFNYVNNTGEDNSSVRWSLPTGLDNTYFTMTSTSNILLDEDSNIPTVGEYHINVEISENVTSKNLIKTMTVNVVDEIIDLVIDGGTSITVDENSTTVGTLSVTGGTSITYSLETGDGVNDADNSYFDISGSSLIVAAGQELDYETKTTYKLFVKATDSGGSETTQGLTVNLNDLAESPAPVISSVTLSGSYEEGGSVLASVVASDTDISSYKYQWQISSNDIDWSNYGNEITNSSSSTTDSNTLTIPSTQDIVGEYFRVVVTVTDLTAQTATATSSSTTQISNVNDAPSDIILTPADDTWTQIGDDILGEANNDYSGYSVTSSSDGTIIAIGAVFNDDGGSNSGHVRVYELDGTTWNKKGSDIDGEAIDDEFGTSISLSSNGLILAVGSRYNDGNGVDSGSVRVYQWDTLTTDWIRMGTDLDGEGAGDLFGKSVSLSSNGTILAIGGTQNSDGGSTAGSVRVFEWNSVMEQWDQKGDDIDGSANNLLGGSVSLNSNGLILAVGAIKHNSFTGYSRVYRWAINKWEQMGDDIVGDDTGDRQGFRVKLNSEGTILATSSAFDDNNGVDSGTVRVYEWISNNWSQKGTDINGPTGGQSGTSLSLSGNGLIVGIGSPFYNTNTGVTRVYQFLSGDWSQLGADLNGSTTNIYGGYDISLSSDGLTLVNSYYSENSNKGVTRIFKNKLAIDENNSNDALIGLLSVNDVDPSESITYTLHDETSYPDNSNFIIANTNEVRANSISFNYESKSSYNFQIRATDSSGSTFDKEFTLEINDVNEEPTNITIDVNNIDENTTGSVGSLTLTDEDSDNTYTWSILGVSGKKDGIEVTTTNVFSLSGSTTKNNTLILDSSVNFETVDSYLINIRVNDGLNVYDESLTILINDVNEIPTDILLSNDNINENNNVNDLIGTLSTIDVDESNTYTYSVLSVRVGSTSLSNPTTYFNVGSGSDSDKLLAKRSFDYESVTEYIVTVNVNDGENDFSKNFTIYINEINESPTEIILSNNTIIESESANTLIGTLTNVDEDVGNIYTYSVTKVLDANNTELVALDNFKISGDNLLSSKSFVYDDSPYYDVTINVNDGSNDYKEVLRINIQKLFTEFQNLPSKYFPCVTYMVINYSGIKYKVNFLVQKTNVETTVNLKLEDIHPFSRSIELNMSVVNTLSGIFEILNGEYSLGSLNKYYNSDNVIGFSDDSVNNYHYMRILESSTSINSYIEGMDNTYGQMPLISLYEKNLVFYFTSTYFYDYLDSSTRTNEKFNTFFNDTKINDNSSFLGDKNTLIYNNHNDLDIDKFEDLKNLSPSSLTDVDNFKTEMVPENISLKNRYFYTVNDSNNVSETNIILKLSDGTLNNVLNSYNIKYNDGNEYDILLNGFNVVLYNYKDNKIGPMEFSRTGLYFYKTITENDKGINIRDLQDARFTFVIKLKDYSIPINLNSEYIPLSIPLKIKNESNETNSYILNRSNNKYVLKSLYENKYDNIILNLDNDDVLDKNGNIVNSLFTENKIINIFVSYRYNGVNYYFNVKNVGSNEFLETETLKLPFNYVLKYLPSYTDDTERTKLTSAKLIMIINNSQEKEYSLDLNSYTVSTNRKANFGTELKVIDRNEIGRDFSISENDLKKYVYLISKLSLTWSDVSDKSINYFFKINLNDDSDDVGYSFENNAYVDIERSFFGVQYKTYYSIFYNKDLIINDIFSGLDNNFVIGGNNTVRLEFYNFTNPDSFNDSFEINQEIIQYDTVGSQEFEDNVTSLIEAEVQKIEDILAVDPTEVETEETIASKEKIETLNSIVSEMREFGFFSANTKLEVNTEALSQVRKSDVSFIEGVTDSSGEEVAIISDDSSSIRETVDQVIGTKAIKLEIIATSLDGSKIKFEVLKTNNALIIKLTKYIKKVVPLVFGSLVVNIIVTHLITNYSLDNNILPGAEINNYNYSEQALRAWSLNTFEAEALNIIYKNASYETKEDQKIHLPVKFENGVFELLVYDDTFSGVLESGSEYEITIKQTGKADKKFILPFYIRGITFKLGEDYTNDTLGISFSKEMRINSYWKYLMVNYGNMNDVSLYLEEEKGGVFNNIEDVDFSEITIDTPVYIYTNEDSLRVGEDLYDLEMLFDKYYYRGFAEGVIAMRGVGYGGSGIVEITYYGPGTVPCITKDSYILTPSGEKCITELNEGDLVRTMNGENVPIIKKMVRKVNRLSKMPYIIPKNHYGNNIPNKDIFISPNHAYYLKQKNGEFIIKYPKHQPELKQTEWETVTYYNLKLPDYHKHQFICNGLAMESWNDDDKNIKSYTWVRRGNNIYKVFQ